MRIIFYVIVTGVSAVVTFGFAFLILKLSHRYRLYPKVRERDVHTRPTPRLGGIAMFLGIVVAFAIASQLPGLSLIFSEPLKIFGLLTASLIIVLIGVADDVWDLDWMTKLAGQIIAAGALAWSGIQIYTLPIGGYFIPPPMVSLVITVLAVVLVMNAINFIDGLDGLVAGVAIIANGVFFIYSYVLAASQGQSEYFNLASLITAVLIGACLGFLPLNFHPAKMFMGDAGALLVGLLMAASAISVTGQVDPGFLDQPDIFTAYLLPAFIPILLPFAVLLIPLLDFALAVVRRLSKGKSPFSADRLHLHHRLLDMGHSHLQSVLIFYGWTAVIAVGCLSFMFLPFVYAAVLVGVGLLVCAIVTLGPLRRSRTPFEREAEAVSDAHNDTKGLSL
ncbi:MAG: undecaprenyl-phosphate alpha-N-acetylglucosaminyl 1-phosphate transferase [Microbacteriaceae bacterium]|nr:undecaprenyl-phosphate alpha-N-acetylglucosaminyl 1-phosphate transferase [Microbacteriaceae bacterium]